MKVEYGSFKFNFDKIADSGDKGVRSFSQVNFYELKIDKDSIEELGYSASSFPVAKFGYLTTNGRKGQTAWTWEIETKRGRKALPFSRPDRIKKSNDSIANIMDHASKSVYAAAQLIIENSPLKGTKTMKKTSSLNYGRRTATIDEHLSYRIARAIMRTAAVIEKYTGTQEDADKEIQEIKKKYDELMVELEKFQEEKLGDSLKKYNTDVKTAKAGAQKFKAKLKAIDDRMNAARKKMIDDLTKEFNEDTDIGAENIEDFIKLVEKKFDASKKDFDSIGGKITDFELKLIQLCLGMKEANINIDALKNIIEIGEQRISTQPMHKEGYVILFSLCNKLLKEKYNLELPDNLLSKTLVDFKMPFEDFERTYGELPKVLQDYLEKMFEECKENFMTDEKYKDAREAFEGTVTKKPAKTKKSSVNIRMGHYMIQANLFTTIKKKLNKFWDWGKNYVKKAYEKLTGAFDDTNKQLDDAINELDSFNNNIKKTIKECRKVLANM